MAKQNVFVINVQVVVNETLFLSLITTNFYLFLADEEQQTVCLLIWLVVYDSSFVKLIYFHLFWLAPKSDNNKLINSLQL